MCGRHRRQAHHALARHHETSRDVTTTTQRDVDASPAGTVTPQMVSVAVLLPVSSESDYGEPGITEAGVAYGVSPMIGGFNRIIVHLRPGRSRKRGG